MGLIHPGMLAGLLALSLPVAIHLLRSRRYRRVEIGTIRFLQVALRERSRWRRIENWPLLLARLAGVILLTLLFARPFLPEREKILPQDLEAVLLVDASGSVSGLHFEAVKEAVRHVLAGIPAGAKVTIAPFADEVQPLAAPSVETLHAVPGARTDYLRLVNWTLDHLAQSERKATHVWLIGDLQRAGLPTSPPRLWPANCQASVVAIPPAAKWNAAIARVELLTPYVTAEGEAEMEVTVLISGEAPSARREVTFAIEGMPPMKQTAEAKGGRLIFRWKPGRALQVRGVAEITSDDALPEDNRRPFAAQLKLPKEVRLVEGGKPLTAFEGESYYLAKALEVTGKEHGHSPYTTHAEWKLEDLKGVDAVALCNTSALPQEDLARLQEFVRAGGSAALFLGSNTQPGQWPVSDLYPAKISPVETIARQPLDWWDRTDPLLARFDGAERGDLRNVVLRDAFALEGGPEWKVLARLENGHAALLTREFRRGRVLVFANPLTRAWSDFPTTRIFLPLMQEWFAWLTRLDPAASAPIELAPGFSETRAPGVYQKGERLEIVAPDPAEMDVAVADEATLRKSLGLPPEEAPPPPASDSTLPRSRERQNEIWPWIALVLLAFLTLENRFADRRRPAL